MALEKETPMLMLLALAIMFPVARRIFGVALGLLVAVGGTIGLITFMIQGH